MLLLLLSTACEHSSTVVEMPAPADDSCGTWASVGHPFVLTWCTSCHSGRLTGADRYGAPASVNLDTLDEVRGHAEAISRRSLGPSADMPPRGGVSVSELEAVEAWLACGAPGEESAFPRAERDLDLLDATTLTGAIEADGGGRVLLLEEGGLPWLTQRFEVDNDGRGSLVGFSRYEAGVEVEAVEFEPPLQIYDEAVATASGDPVVTRSTPAGSDVATESWTVTREIDADPDPRFMDDAPSRVVAELDGEPALLWWFSATRMLVAQAQQELDGSWTTVLNTAPAAQRDGTPGFPLDEGGSWASRGTSLSVAP
ncbi:hypothetical protein LBMAG42_42830 [Deltaproteobacteria bacterium]|nr:hypothetical protein LBMAG42_42830 [Deltaproteobacteria bacterium]